MVLLVRLICGIVKVLYEFYHGAGYEPVVQPPFLNQDGADVHSQAEHGGGKNQAYHRRSDKSSIHLCMPKAFEA